jgi:hypothetical protein
MDEPKDADWYEKLMEQVRRGPAVTRRRAKAEDQYLYLPTSWLMAARRVLPGGDQVVVACLLYRRWLMKRKAPFAASAAALSCEGWAPSPGVRTRTIKALAEAGLIRLVGVGVGRAPRVEVVQTANLRVDV